MLKNIIRAIARFLRATGRLTWNVTKKTFEWTVDRIESVWDSSTETFDAVIHAPAGLLRKLTGGGANSGPAVSETGQKPQEASQKRKDVKHDAIASTNLDDALAVRTATRALIRGEPTTGINGAQTEWLLSLSRTELADLSILKPEEIARVLCGADVKGVAGFEFDGWVKKLMLKNLRTDLNEERLRRLNRANNIETKRTAKPRTPLVIPTDEQRAANIKDLSERIKAQGYSPVRLKGTLQSKAS